MRFLQKTFIGKIDKSHPKSEEIDKAVDELNKTANETFTSVGKMINEITSFTDNKPN